MSRISQISAQVNLLNSVLTCSALAVSQFFLVIAYLTHYSINSYNIMYMTFCLRHF